MKFRFTIGKKITSAFAVAIVFFAGTGFLSYGSFQKVKSSSDTIVADAIPTEKAAENLLTDLVNEETAIRGYIITDNGSFLQPYNDGKDQLDKDIRTIRSQESKHPIMKDLLEKQAMPQIQNIQDFFQNEIRLVQSDNTDQAILNIDNGKQAMDQFRIISDKMIAEVQRITNDSWNQTNQTIQSADGIIEGATSFVLLLTIVIGIFLTNGIVRPVRRVKNQLFKIAEGEGDLTTQLELKSNDEIGDLVNAFTRMMNGLRQMIAQVGNSAELVAAASEQLTASAEQTSAGTRMITSSIQEIAYGSEKQVENVEYSVTKIYTVSDEVKQIADASNHVSIATEQAYTLSSEGMNAVKLAITQMDSIHASVEQLSVSVRELGDRTGQISQIVDAITSIASQTNLLALNAAIEAARAGEQGRGFAVVANEVRKLAEQSSQSAQKISELIQSIQKDAVETVEKTTEVSQEVERGLTVVNSAGDAFNRINLSVVDVTQQIREVTQVANRMMSETELAVEAITTIASVTEQSAAATQNVSAASEEQLASMDEIKESATDLAKQASELQELVSRFKV